MQWISRLGGASPLRQEVYVSFTVEAVQCLGGLAGGLAAKWVLRDLVVKMSFA